MRTKTNKFLTVMLVVLSVVFMSLGVIIAKPTTNYGASAQDTASVLVMDEGASIRVEDHQGLKFTAKISDADYQDLCTQYGAENVKFGMLIAPATFAELNEANVFGNEYAEPVFGWAEYDETNDDWAAYNGSKDQIINIFGQNVHATNDGYWAFSGSMSNLQLSSLINKFQGRAYIEIDLGAGAKDYIFADTNNNVVTPYAVAAKVAFASGAETGLNDEQQDWIIANYVNVIKSEAVQGNVADAGLVKADTINLDNQALKAFPDSGAKLSLPAVDSLYSVELVRYFNAASANAYSATAQTIEIIDTIEILSNDWSLDISGLAEGMYKLTATINEIADYVIYFEKYVEGVFTWNNLTASEDVAGLSIKLSNGYDSNIYKDSDVTVSVVDSALGREGSYFRIDGITSTNRAAIGMNVYPIHSKAYYQMFYTADTDVMFTFDIGAANSADETQVNNEWGGNSRGTIYYGMSPLTSADYAHQYVNGWTTVPKVSFKTLIDTYWGRIAGTEQTGTFFGGLKGVPGSYAKGVVYLGNFRLVDIAYTQEHYFETGAGTGVFEKREANPDEVLTADFGATVNFVPATETGNYVYDASNVNAVLSGVNNGSLVLKGYYVATNEPKAETLTGIQTADKHILDNCGGEILSVSVQQYVVKSSGSSLYLTEGVETKAVAVDATALYSANVKKGVEGIYIDTTGLDGIFTFTVESTLGEHELTFEQKTDGFVWNNLSNDTAKVGVKGTNGYNSGGLYSSNSLGFVNEALGRTGNYYQINAGSRDIAFGVFPVHSKAYYEAFAAEYPDATLDFDIGSEKTASFLQADVLSGMTGAVSKSNIYFTNNWAVAGFSQSLSAKIIPNWDTLITATNKGTFIGRIHNSPSGNNSAPNDVFYIGNYRLSTVTADYVEEVYTETAVGSGEFVKNEDLTSIKSATYGAWLEATPATFEGYEFDAENVNNALKGVNDGSFVVKTYYNKVKTSVSETLMGIQSGSTIALSNCAGEIESVTVKQYVVKASGDVTLTLSEGVDTVVKGVDVTDLYASNVKADNGVYIDTTGLDGIFTFSVETAGGNHEVTFEQETVGVFNWNTLASEESVYVSARYANSLSGYPLPTYTLSIVEQSGMAAELEGTGLTTTHKFYNANSWYARIHTTAITSGIGFTIYPGHTKAYYEAWVTVQDENFNMPFATENTAVGANTARLGGYFSSDANNVYWRDNGSGGDGWGSTSGSSKRAMTTLSNFLTDSHWSICIGETVLGQFMTKQFTQNCVWYVGCPFFVA